MKDVEETNFEVKEPSPNFYINENEEEIIPAKMISNINEIPNILQNLDDGIEK